MLSSSFISDKMILCVKLAVSLKKIVTITCFNDISAVARLV